MRRKEMVILPTGEVPYEFLSQIIFYLMGNSWHRKEWISLDAMKSKDDGSIVQYVEELYDEEEYELIEKGWNKEHCLVCSRNISEENSALSDNYGYFDNENWICESCHNILIETDDPFKTISQLERKFIENE